MGKLGTGHIGYGYGDGIVTAEEAFESIERVRKNLLKTDKKKIFKVGEKRNGKKNFETCLITSFAGKEYCFENYLNGISHLPTHDMCAVIYDNSNSKRFGKKIIKEMSKRFKRYVHVVDENAHYIVENTKEYFLIAERAFNIYNTILDHYLINAKYTMIIEDDVEVEKGTYEKFIKLMDLYPKIGTIVGNQHDRHPAENDIGDGHPHPVVWHMEEVRDVVSGDMGVRMKMYDRSKKVGLEAVASAHTGCWLTRTNLLKSVKLVYNYRDLGGWDQVWGYRLNKMGKSLVVDWASPVKHYYQLNGKKGYL